MKYWSGMPRGEREETIKNFLEQVASVCQHYNLSLSHQDSHGAFLVSPYSKENEAWLLDAMFMDE